MTESRVAWFQPRHRKQADTDWMARALCRKADIPTAVFFEDYDKARGICYQCPVAHECRSYAFETEEKYGIWGGVMFTDWTPPDEGKQLTGRADPRVREAYRRVWARTKEGDDVRRHLRKLSDPELDVLAALEGFL